MKTKELQNLFTIYRNEWQNAVLVNPFYIFKKYSDSEHIFEDVAELFLQSTDYMSSPEFYIRETEKVYLTICFAYLTFYAIDEEMTLTMVIEVLNSDRVEGRYIDDEETDFQRLINTKKDDNEALIVYKYFELYKKESVYIRQQALQSLALRLFPLNSFHNYDEDSDENIIEDFNESFLLQLSISLLHNCNSKPEEPLSLVDKKMMISYIFACLKFCFDNEIHIRRKILNFIRNNKVKPNFEIKSDNMCVNNQSVEKYWKKYKHIPMSSQDMNRIDEIKNFYDGCGC